MESHRKKEDVSDCSGSDKDDASDYSTSDDEFVSGKKAKKKKGRKDIADSMDYSSAPPKGRKKEIDEINERHSSMIRKASGISTSLPRLSASSAVKSSTISSSSSTLSLSRSLGWSDSTSSSSSPVPVFKVEENKTESKEEKKEVGTTVEEKKSAPAFKISRASVRLENSLEDKRDFSLWKVYLEGEILNVIRSKNFDAFKFLMGPVFYPIQSRLRNEMDLEIEARDFHAFCKIFFYDRILEGMIIFSSYERNKQLLLSCDQAITNQVTESAELHSESKDILNKVKSSHNEILSSESKQNKLEAYKKWCDDHSSTIEQLTEGVILGIRPVTLLQDDEIELTSKKKEELRVSLLGWISPWVENRVYETFSIDTSLKKQVVHYLSQLQDKLLDKLLEGPNLKSAIDKSKQFALAKKEKDSERQLFYQTKIEEEKVLFRAFATNFLNNAKGRMGVHGFLMSTTTGKGKNVSELIDMIIKYNLLSDQLGLDQQMQEKIFKELSGIKDNPVLHQQFKAELEKHFFSPWLREGLGRGKTINDQLKHTKDMQHVSTFSPKESIEYNRKILKEAYKAAFENFKEAQLNEYQLRLALDYFSCTTQAQILVKNVIRKYLDVEFEEWLPWVRSFYSTKPEKRVCQIQYLISVLYMAKDSECDEGILFSDPRQVDSYCVGVNLVLEVIRQEQSHYSWLQEKLQGCLESISTLMSGKDLLAEVGKDEDLLESRKKEKPEEKSSSLIEIGFYRLSTGADTVGSQREKYAYFRT